jgi:hypothetical protein
MKSCDSQWLAKKIQSRACPVFPFSFPLHQALPLAGRGKGRFALEEVLLHQETVGGEEGQGLPWMLVEEAMRPTPKELLGTAFNRRL